MDKLKKEKEEHFKFEIGGYLSFASGFFLVFLGISPLFGFSIPSINLKGIIGSLLDGWLIYGIINYLDLIGELISFFRWHKVLDIINISLLFSVNILYFIAGVISFQRKNKIGIIGTILFIIVLILVIIDLFTESLIVQLPFSSEPNIILRIFDTNIIIIIILGFLNGYFFYFKT